MLPFQNQGGPSKEDYCRRERYTSLQINSIGNAMRNCVRDISVEAPDSNVHRLIELSILNMICLNIVRDYLRRQLAVDLDKLVGI